MSCSNAIIKLYVYNAISWLTLSFIWCSCCCHWRPLFPYASRPALNSWLNLLSHGCAGCIPVQCTVFTALLILLWFKHELLPTTNPVCLLLLLNSCYNLRPYIIFILNVKGPAIIYHRLIVNCIFLYVIKLNWVDTPSVLWLHLTYYNNFILPIFSMLIRLVKLSY